MSSEDTGPLNARREKNMEGEDTKMHLEVMESVG
jgi:hypothetical protein